MSWETPAGKAAPFYTLHWVDLDSAISEPIAIFGVTSPFKHKGLSNFTRYEYTVTATYGSSQSPASNAVIAEPGPMPGDVNATAVITSGETDVLEWSSVANATSYRVYYAQSLAPLLGRRPTAPFVELDGALRSTTIPAVSSESRYYRVLGVNGARISAAGGTAIAPSFHVTAIDLPRISPALFDINDDGCLDMISAIGNCRGDFATRSLEETNLIALFEPGRVNRDSRVADFNNDGYPDVFTNTYSRADDPRSVALLHLNRGDGTFAEDTRIRDLAIGGFGETVVTADFDNDGDLDIFLPYYWHRDDGGRNWLLINDGQGAFIDRAVEAGLDRDLPQSPYIPEAAHGLDFNQDGWIDIHVASRLYINNGNLTFTDRSADVRLPQRFDEGMRFFDVDLDGDFDLIHHDGITTRLHRNEEGLFDDGEIVNGGPKGETFGYGLAVCDINGDGYQDVFVANNDSTTTVGEPRPLINVMGTLMPSDLGFGQASAAYGDLMACADLDWNGLPDLIARWGGYRALMNKARNDSVLRIRVLGSGGERNQQGRVVRISPVTRPDFVMLRLIESGSGYMAQSGYDLSVAAPWPGPYEVAVRSSSGWISTTTGQGRMLTFYADGRANDEAFGPCSRRALQFCNDTGLR